MRVSAVVLSAIVWALLVHATPALAAVSNVTINGAGSSFPATAIRAQISAFQASAEWTSTYSGTIAYTGLSDDASVAVAQLAANTISFLGTDIALTAAQIQTVSAARSQLPVLHLPQTLTGVAVIYNLPGFSGQLNVTASVMARILNRNITRWNDPLLLAFNPLLANSRAQLDNAIIPCGRSDPASTTHEITAYLSSFSSEWPTGAALSYSWPSGVHLEGDGGPMAQYVVATPYSIGYAKKRTAENNGASRAALLNKFNNFIAPSSASITLAVTSSAALIPALSAADNSWSALELGKTATDPLAYPASWLSFVVVVASNTATAANDVNLANALSQFVVFFSSEAATAALPTGFIPLTADLQTRNQKAAVTFIRAGGTGAGGIVSAAGQPADSCLAFIVTTIAVWFVASHLN